MPGAHLRERRPGVLWLASGLAMSHYRMGNLPEAKRQLEELRRRGSSLVRRCFTNGNDSTLGPIGPVFAHRLYSWSGAFRGARREFVERGTGRVALALYLAVGSRRPTSRFGVGRRNV